MWMGSILAILFLGITFLARQTNAVPSESETVISQITRTIFGGEGIIYGIVVAMTALILVLAANTAFAGFPRLAAILAQDGYLPRQFTYRGSWLVILDSPYRPLVEPILDYIGKLNKIRQKNEKIIVVVPQFVSRHWWTGILHNQTAFMLRLGLLLFPGVIIIEVPYQVK